MPSSSLPSSQSSAPVDSVPATGHQQSNDEQNSKTESLDTHTRHESQESTQKSSLKQDSTEFEAQVSNAPHLDHSTDPVSGTETQCAPLSPQSAATAAVAALSVQRSVSQDVHQMQTQSSFVMRFSSRLRMKSHLVCCIYFVTTFLSLFILVLIAIIIFLYWKPISRTIIIDQNIEQKGIDFEIK